MNVLKSTITRAGLERITVEVPKGTRLVAVHDDRMYKLGHPIEDIVPGHIISESVPVMWCPVGQEWVS